MIYEIVVLWKVLFSIHTVSINNWVSFSLFNVDVQNVDLSAKACSPQSEEPSSTNTRSTTTTTTIHVRVVFGVGVSVNGHQMTVKAGQDKILIHGEYKLPWESLKNFVATVLKLNVPDVVEAGVKHDSLVLFEVNFSSQASFERLCKSLYGICITVLCRHVSSYLCSNHNRLRVFYLKVIPSLLIL